MTHNIHDLYQFELFSMVFLRGRRNALTLDKEKKKTSSPNAFAMHQKQKNLLPHSREILENTNHVGVGLLSTTTRTLLLLGRRGSNNDLGLGSSGQFVG